MKRIRCLAFLVLLAMLAMPVTAEPRARVFGGSAGSTDCNENQIPDELEPDNDDDGIIDDCDNCPSFSSLFQTDTDLDGEGDVCDFDDGIYLLFIFNSNVVFVHPEDFDEYNVYVGDLSVLLSGGEYTQPQGPLSGVTCDAGIFSSILDIDVPPGPGMFVIASGVTGGIESGLGEDSSGTPRPNANPCPPPFDVEVDARSRPDGFGTDGIPGPVIDLSRFSTHVEIAASGTWCRFGLLRCSGPSGDAASTANGPLPGLPYNMLGGEWKGVPGPIRFVVANGGTFSIPSGATGLQLYFNDDIDSYDNNTGTVTATVN